MNPEELAIATKEQLIQAYLDVGRKEEEIAGEKQAIKEEILARMDTDSEIVGNYSVTRAKRVSFSVTIDQARDLGAIKEAVDNDALKKMAAGGMEIPGMKVSVYPVIRDIGQEKEKQV